jgi:hypothetical protein
MHHTSVAYCYISPHKRMPLLAENIDGALTLIFVPPILGVALVFVSF